MSSFDMDNCAGSLKQHRDDLLLAEVGALLHDIGKCTSEFVYFPQARSQDGQDPYKAIFKREELARYSFSGQRVQERSDEASNQYALHRLLDANILSALDRSFASKDDSYSLREAIYFSRPRFAGHIGSPIGRCGKPLDLLAFCHGEGHIEKEEPSPRVDVQTVSCYSPFGFKLDDISAPAEQSNMTQRLNELDFGKLTERSSFLLRLRELFGKALGDTRFPINEVTLWDWSYTVASLYKSELARHFLTDEWRNKGDLRWRLLRVNFDVLGLYAKAIKIADLLAYQRAVEDACKKVKVLIEEDYPLGNEVYRDTTGVYFTFPDIELPAELEREIRHRIEEVERELAPRIRVESGEGKDAGEQLKNLLAGRRRQARRELAKPMAEENLSPYWQNKWGNLSGGKWEICPVCRLRPMKEGGETCKHCRERRQSRIDAWKKDPTSTIWMDEVADGNGRVALLVGKFGLDGWLSGDLVQTLLVKAAEDDPNRCEPKNPSPARLRRVWETTQRFWEKTVVDSLQKKLCDRHRWELFPDSMPDVPEETVCDGTLGGRPISVVRVGDRFLTVSYLSEKPSPGHLEVWWERGREKKRISCEINEVSEPDQEGPGFRNYRPYLPLVSSPDRFLALVPADSALDVADGIRREYEEQFGKVQNRLPIFLGLVFFQRKMPLAAVVDAGRRMLEQVRLEEESGWKVQDKKNGGSLVELALADGGRETRQKIPVRMGDGVTEDRWYPYFFFEGKPEKRKRYFKHVNSWLVHVEDLQEGDSVRVSPSRFSYLYLEHAERRFRFDPGRDAMLLDELPRLRGMWKKILETPGMTTAKLQGLRTLFETKQQLWRLDNEEVPNIAEAQEAFEKLAETALKREGISNISADDVLSGRFRRCLELHLHVLRKRVEEVKRG